MTIDVLAEDREHVASLSILIGLSIFLAFAPHISVVTAQQPSASASIALERKTAPFRKDDDLICRGGMDEMKASLERGTQKEVPNTTGHYGKTVAVTPPPDWTPKFVSPNVYRPMQEKARANMRELVEPRSVVTPSGELRDVIWADVSPTMYYADDIDALRHSHIEDYIIVDRKAAEVLTEFVTHTACLRHGQQHIKRVS